MNNHATFRRGACLFGTLLLGVVVCVPSFANAQYPVLENLRETEIEFDFDVPQFLAPKKEQALRILRDAGVRIAAHLNTQLPLDKLPPWLQLTVRVIDLGEWSVIDTSKTPAVPRDLKLCPGKKLYIRKLELLEKVVIPRLPVKESPIWISRTVTWSRALPLPIIVESLSEDEIWRDVEKMLRDFAEDFEPGNHIRK
ncbi:MAG: hypothetical protein H8K03_14905 [Nitrospira sp.]